MGKRERRTVRLDEDVLAVEGMGERRRLSAGERRRRERRERNVAVSWELDRVLVRVIREMADELDIAPGGVASRILLAGLEQYAGGAVDFEGVLEPSRSPRYYWGLDIGDLRDGIGERVRGRLDEVLGDGEI